MRTRVVLATRNAGKVEELRRILDGMEIELLGADDVGLPDVEETGTTFQENALLKARSAAVHADLPAVADDSGLEVDALQGEPGVRSARFAGRHGDDAANLELLLQRLEGVPGRRARFVCAAALALPDGRAWLVDGVLEGEVVHEPRGDQGFGYDPVFRPLGETRTTAELPAVEKDAISHRGIAFRRLRRTIAAVLH